MTQRHGQRPSPLWPLSLRAMASSLKAVVVVSDGRQAQAGSLAQGRESACLADGQLPVLTNPGSCPCVSTPCFYAAGWALELPICK